MAGLFVSLLLVTSLLLVHFSVRARPMPKDFPLNVDIGLPWPEAGQASTVFSLTALFGAYFGIFLVLGIPAVMGLASGTVLGLFLLRSWVLKHGSRTFEEFLLALLDGHPTNAGVFALSVSLTQCAYAASELLILRELARITLGVRSDHATVLAVSIGIIGYFYVLFGGYTAVFKTDILQFLLVSAMAIACAIHLLIGNPSVGWMGALGPRPGYWEPPLVASVIGKGKYLYHFVIGTVMGLGLLAAAPDAWKRVFIVTKFKKPTVARFLTFIAIGVGPFVALLPLALSAPRIPDGEINAAAMFTGLLSRNLLYTATALGLVASFLSAFDSAVLASVHVGLMLRRQQHGVKDEVPRFHWLMTTALLTIFLIFASLVPFANPYLLGNILLGPFAILAGIQVGTRAAPSRLPENSLLWIVALSFSGWLVYFGSVLGFPEVPTTLQVNTVPGGVGVFSIVVLLSYALSAWRRKNA